MSKMFNRKLTVYGFSLSLAALMLSQALPDRTFSPLENRNLDSPPDFTWQNISSGDFSDDIESYLQDQIPARDFFVKLYGQTAYVMGRDDLNDAYIGKGGTFLEVREGISLEDVERNAKRIEEIANSTGIKTWFLGIASAYTADPDRLPNYAYAPDEVQIYDSTTEHFESVTPIYIAADGENYFKTDHHWTQDGAYQGYVALANAMGLVPTPLEEYERHTVQDFLGSLYSRAPRFNVEADELVYYTSSTIHAPTVNYLDTGVVSDSYIDGDALLEKDKYTAFLGGNNAQIVIETGADTGRRLVLLKDSFSHPMVQFLAPHFDEIAVLDLRYYKQSVEQYAEQFGATDILFAYNLSWFAEDNNIR